MEEMQKIVGNNPCLRPRHTVHPEHKNPLSWCQSGFRCSHALAAFLERPQAEYQIGAERILYQKSLSSNIHIYK